MNIHLAGAGVAYAQATQHLDDCEDELSRAEGVLRKAQDEVNMKLAKVERARETERVVWRALQTQHTKSFPEKAEPLDFLLASPPEKE